MNQQHRVVTRKNLFVVLGMARSGTSVIARGLKALGIDWGKNLLPADNNWNAKGFWEDGDIVYKINRELVRTFDYSWQTENLLENIQANPELQRLQNLAIILLQQRLLRVDYWGFKDPRTSKLLPFWQSVFSRLNVNEHYIIALRNPLASAHSFAQLTGYDFEIGLLLWLLHLIPAISQTTGKKRIMVSYELMLQNPRAQLERIKNYFHLSLLTNNAEIDEYVNEFLDKNLYHYDYKPEDLSSHPSLAVAPLCATIYNLLLKVAQDQIEFASQEFTNAWREIENEYAKVQPIYYYLGKLVNDNRLSARKIRHMQKSFFWKLLYPLRWFEDKFRATKRKIRMKKRLAKNYG